MNRIPTASRSAVDSSYVPTDDDRRTVQSLAALSIPVSDIALLLGLSAEAVREHFVREIASAATRADAAVEQALYRAAASGDVEAIALWKKTRPGAF